MSRRKLLSLRVPRSALLGLLATAALGLATPAAAQPGFSPRRFAAIAIDVRSGRTLYARNADARRYPASLTKVMTLYVAFDEIEHRRLRLDDSIVISRHAAAQAPTKLGLAPGARISVRDAINVIAVKSANDIAVALAEKIAGSEAGFVHRMNRTAQRLGMRHTHFDNASGLPDPANVSTARDLSRLAKAFIAQHPEGYAVFDQEQTRFRGRWISGHNRLIAQPGIDGVKTGYIRASGFNLITSGVRDGHRVVAVVLGGDTARVRDAFMTRLMRTSFARLASPTRARAIVTAAAAPSQAPAVIAKAGAPAASGADIWWVQVGAFETRGQALAALEAASARHPDLFADAPRGVDRPGNLFQARFNVFSEADAREGCALLERDGRRCVWFGAAAVR